MNRYRVAILRGGLSSEYGTSMRTGMSVLENIDTKRFNPIDIVVTKNGEWIVDGRARMPEYLLHSVDVVFNALHGSFGEDGTVQRLFERYGVAHTGSKPFASAIAMNKVQTKNHLKHMGIKVPQHVQVSRDSINDLGRVAEKIVDTFGTQYIIKPVSSGGSAGTMCVKNPLLLEQALKDALTVYDEVMVEAKIAGREATCGVVERYRDKQMYVLPTVEVTLPKGLEFQTYEAKCNCKTRNHCPASFERNIKDEIEKISEDVHRELGLSQYSRSDFIVADNIPGRQEGGIYFLEVNTLPQLSPDAQFRKALTAVGVSYSDFITHLLTDALATSRR